MSEINDGVDPDHDLLETERDIAVVDGRLRGHDVLNSNLLLGCSGHGLPPLVAVNAAASSILALEVAETLGTDFLQLHQCAFEIGTLAVEVADMSLDLVE